MEKKQLTTLIEHQTNIISKIALGAELSECLNDITQHIENILTSPQAKASIQLLHGDSLHQGSAPSLHSDYCAALEGAMIGPCAGSCGTAAYSGEQVVVADIEHNPLWEDYSDLALKHGLKACWSTPIRASDERILGTLAVYYGVPKSPSRDHQEYISHCCHLASLAIEKHQSHVREHFLNQQLTQVVEKMNSLLTLLPEVLVVLDEQGNYVDIYGGDVELFNWNGDTLLGRSVYDVVPPDTSRMIMSAVQATLKSGAIGNFENEVATNIGMKVIENRTAIINNYRTDNPKKKHVLWMLRDITKQKRAQTQIEKLAYYDPLTDLPNRRLLMNRTQKVIERSARERQFGALIYIDLNDFKRINDSLGHHIGDELLISVSQRLQDSIREMDTIARIGGDEFVVLLENLKTNSQEIADEAKLLSERILHDLDEHFELSGGRYKISASIGIAIIDNCDTDAIDVLKHADAAMYEAKKRRKEHIFFHNPDLQEKLDQQILIESEINEGLEQMAFHAFYQPQLDINGEVIAAEALIRWHHPEKGVLAPGQFIPIAERMGVIHKMQQTVLTQACQTIQLLEHRHQLSDDFRIAINICPSQLKSKSLPTTLMQTLDLYGISPKRFMLEITEGMLIDDLDRSIHILHELRDLGFKVAIDDFGTGYSSLSYLNQLPVNEIKIDKSFVEGVTKEPSSQGIIDTVVSLSKYFHFDVIAEGIEEQTQLEVIQSKEIKGLQGYYFAKPMNQADFIDWVAAA